MKKITKDYGFFWVIMAILIFSGVIGYGNWTMKNLQPSPRLFSFTSSELGDAWEGEEKPLFPPQTSLGDSFEYDIELSSRWLPEAVYIGYSGIGLSSKSQQYIPFAIFNISCSNSQIEQLNDHKDNLHIETIDVRENSSKLHVSYHLLDDESHKNLELRKGKGCYILLIASFTYNGYCYYFRGAFSLAESEFSMDDPNVLKAREIVVQFVNDMTD